jgi:hypothetical protein
MVHHIRAVAEFDRRADAAESMRARARGGDTDSAWMVEQWERGRLVLAQIVLSAYADDGDGLAVLAEHVIHGVWLERENFPAVEQQVADVAPAELPELAQELRRLGVAVDDDDAFEASYLHIELESTLRAALRG